MNEFIEAIVLGIVQGLTEFLPVSSSGHLELMKFLLKDDSLAEQSMLTTVFLHFATALSTIWVFRKDILEIVKGLFNSGSDDRNFVFFILISMIPAAIIGVMFDELIETFFHRKIVFVSCMLILTGLLLILSEKVKTDSKNLSMGRAFIIGISQALAILPGLSRSGSTIATSLLLGVDRIQSARFSFLMVIPLIFGKIAKDLLSGDLLLHMPSATYLLLGFVAAFVTGILACTAMINFVKSAKLSWFAYYCFIVGIGFIIYSFISN